MKTRIAIAAFACGSCALGAVPAHAGLYSDDLAKCLVESTSVDDKNQLVKWIFSMVALHPAVKSIASVSDEARMESSRQTVQLFEKLLTETCLVQTQKAVKYEGPEALRTGFQMLGQVAAREMFNDPNVAQGLAELGKQIDKDKMGKALGLTPAE